MTFPIKRNDLAPSYAVRLVEGEAALSLVGCTVQFVMTLDGGTVPKVNAPATVTDAAAGAVQYDWSGTDTDTPGLYRCEWKITTPGGRVRTVPSQGHYLIRVHAGLG